MIFILLRKIYSFFLEKNRNPLEIVLFIYLHGEKIPEVPRERETEVGPLAVSVSPCGLASHAVGGRWGWQGVWIFHGSSWIMTSEVFVFFSDRDPAKDGPGKCIKILPNNSNQCEASKSNRVMLHVTNRLYMFVTKKIVWYNPLFSHTRCMPVHCYGVNMYWQDAMRYRSAMIKYMMYKTIIVILYFC